MELIERIQKFKQSEEQLKQDLLTEIKKEFETYDKNKVDFIDSRIDNYFDEPEDVQKTLDELQELTSGVSPLVMDNDCDIDGTASPAYIESSDRGLSLHVYGENWTPENFFITLEKPNWGLTVSDLYGVLKLLQSDAVKNLNLVGED